MKTRTQLFVEVATNQLAGLGNYRVTSLAVDAVIRFEALARRLWTIYPRVVRTVSGVPGRHDVETLNERIAAMDDRVRQLEQNTPETTS